MVVGPFGFRGDRIDPRDGLREVVELEVADQFLPLATPVGIDRRQALVDLWVCQWFHRVRWVRIVSLVPHATELCFAIGLGDELIAVSHECDFPAAALELPRVTSDLLPGGLDAAGIDAAVTERTAAGEAIYALDEARLRELAPDLIITQELCTVCAVSYDDVAALAAELPGAPRVLSLDPHTLGEALADVRTVAQATDRRDEAVALIARAAGRIDRVRLAVRGVRRRTVAALEWLDPVYVAGHWMPQMIEYAGGVDVLGLPGEHSQRVDWEIVAASEPRW